MLEEDIYTETRLVDVVSSLRNVISNILGDYVGKCEDGMKSALATLGRVAVEAVKPQINLTLGEEMSKYFQSACNFPSIHSFAIEGITTIANASYENNSGRKWSRLQQGADELNSGRPIENDEEKMEGDSGGSSDENS